MWFRLIVFAALLFALPLALPVRAQDGLITYKSLSPDLALELARAALAAAARAAFR